MLQSPPYGNGKKMYIFSETSPLLGHFLKKSVFCPLEMSNTCKNFQNPKIAGKWLSIGPHPQFSPNIFFNQNDSEWPEMDFNHNFKNCNILSAGPPPYYNICYNFFFFFNEGFP